MFLETGDFNRCVIEFKHPLLLLARASEQGNVIGSVRILLYIYVIVIPWLRGIIVDNCPDSRGRSPSERAVSVR